MCFHLNCTLQSHDVENIVVGVMLSCNGRDVHMWTSRLVSLGQERTHNVLGAACTPACQLILETFGNSLLAHYRILTDLFSNYIRLLFQSIHKKKKRLIHNLSNVSWLLIQIKWYNWVHIYKAHKEFELKIQIYQVKMFCSKKLKICEEILSRQTFPVTSWGLFYGNLAF